MTQYTAYNYVHPNNHRMIAFLRKRGYTVLNLIEFRKPYKGEKRRRQLQSVNIDLIIDNRSRLYGTT